MMTLGTDTTTQEALDRRAAYTTQKRRLSLLSVLGHTAAIPLVLFALGCDGAEPPSSVPVQSDIIPASPSAIATETSGKIGEVSNKTDEWDAQVSRADEECCTDPGSIALCWWKDAENDNVVCTASFLDNCSSGACNLDIRIGPDKDQRPPQNWGLCTCTEDSECQSGICTAGLLDDPLVKVCAPSYCNGYQVCSCFGGCKEGNWGANDNPEEMCGASADGFHCCEGKYPAKADGTGMGYCSPFCNDSATGTACTGDASCSAEILLDPYSAQCAQYVCDRGRCTLDYVNAAGACTDRVQNDLGYYGDASRDTGANSCFTGVCNTTGRCIAETTLAENKPCDDVDYFDPPADPPIPNSCTDDICVAGQCEHIPRGDDSEPCNLDNEACTLDYCTIDGACEWDHDYSCAETPTDNVCTTNTCGEDSPPDYLQTVCTTVNLSGNAADLGVYADTDPCSDLMCNPAGSEALTPNDCSSENPLSLALKDLPCNGYTCDPAGAEDNCDTHTVLAGNACDDGNACTVGDVCVDNSGVGECQSGPEITCDDSNDCTHNTCNTGTGACVFTNKTAGDYCTDNNPCTLIDTCDGSGTCKPGDTKDCTSFDSKCSDGVCNPSDGNCEASHLAAGTTCDYDGDPCTVGDACDGAGTCVVGPDKVCSALDDDCNTGFCDSSDGSCGKTPRADGTSCEAGNKCRPDDTCQSGVCTQDTNVNTCAAENDQCNSATCDTVTGNCVYDNTLLLSQPCNLDSDGCTTETCQGADASSPLTCTDTGDIECNDGNPCTEDACRSTGNDTHDCDYTNLPNTTACNADSDGCTQDDHCDGSGGCVSGDPVTYVTCKTDYKAAHAAFDLDCNTAECIDDGNNDNGYECIPVPLSPAPAPGLCAADMFGCTLDVCSGNDAVLGATCIVGADRDCSASSNLPCLIGACVEGGNEYSSSCGTTNETAGTACNFDSNGCTVGDACDGAGACAVGAAAVCTPSGPCILSDCNSTGNNAYTCVESVDTGCCTIAADCDGLVTCGASPTCDVQSCVGGICNCVQAADGTDCTAEIEIAQYPENCYDNACATGDCLTSMIDLIDVDNNLCSDLFATSTTFDTANLGYLGSFAQTSPEGTVYSVTGSTLCGENNYKASATNNCKEAGTTTDLGATANDVVYGFDYETEAANSRVDYAYLVKVEANFDVGIYAEESISGATSCKEGNNPDNDVPGPCAPTTTPVVRLGSWQSLGGGSGAISLNYGAAPAGSNRLLVVGIQIEHTVGATTISNVTYGGQSGVQVAAQDPATYQRMELWVFKESKIAAQSGGIISATTSGASYGGFSIHAGMYGNVDQTTPVAEVKQNSTTTNSPNPFTSNDIAAAAGSAVVSFTASGESGTCSWAAGPTEKTDQTGISTAGSIADALVASAATIPCRGTWSLQNRAAQASIELTPVTVTPASCINSVGWTCSYPYSAATTVVEETCATANAWNGQTCCDPCADGSTCGYKWCERGYDTAGTACDLCSGTCDDFWEYPEGPFDCTSVKPADAAYSAFTYKASTLIHPSAKDGTFKKALIYVDGSNGAEGNFYLTVEKVPWISSPCERMDDDVRITNATSVGSSGKTYYDTVNDRVNSNHSYATATCGGYDCTPTWTGNNAKHSTSMSANQFWPAESFYNIYRTSSGSTYCVTTSSPSSNALDAVLTLYKTSGATDLCYEPLTFVQAERNNYLGTGERMTFTASAGTQYLVGVSRYEGLNRPCLNSEGDNCDFDIQIIEGACPTACVALSSWYSGYVGASAVTVNGTTFPTTYTDGTITIYRHLITGNTSSAGRSNAFDIGAGWDGKDEVHQINYTGGSAKTIYFSGCQYGGSGSYNGQMALYDCRGNLLASNDDGCGANGMAAFSYTMSAADSPYYLVVDGKNSTDNGAFNIAVYLAPTCTDGFRNGTETGVDCGGSCPSCTPTCSDGIQNGTETGVDCGGSCPACPCSAGRCKANADCAPATPWCDTSASVLDGSGCGVCRNYFLQCNTTDPNTQLDVDAEHGKRVYIPMNKGCINMDMTNDTIDFDNVNWHNRTIKIQPEAVYSGSCTFPYTMSWTTKYCAAVGGVETLNATFSMSDVLTNCTQTGTIRGTHVVNALWDDIQIPIRRYSMSMDVQFHASDTCELQMVNWYDRQWADPPNPATIYCPPSTLVESPQCNTPSCYFGPTTPVCSPNPPRK